MRIKSSLIVMVVALLLVGGAASAQEAPLGKTTVSGFIGVGILGTDISGDGARFQRYRDLRDGPTGGPFRLDVEGRTWLFNVEADNVGRRGQRYLAELTRPGKFAVEVELDHVPLFYNETTRTLYTETSPGVLRMDDDIRSGIEAGSFGLADVIDRAHVFDLRSRRRELAIDATYRVLPDLDFTAAFSSVQRKGAQQWAGAFGFNPVVEVAAPIDHRTNTVTLGAEWGNQKGMVRLEYLGSWFDNDIQTLIWDHPLSTTDSTSGSSSRSASQGRTAMAPSNTSHTVSATGAISLPARSRLTGLVALGYFDQDEALLPFTINTALDTIPLPRTSAQASARTVSTVLGFTSRPTKAIRINARYRLYDYDNETPVFSSPAYIRMDYSFRPTAIATEPISTQRQNFDVDVGFSPVRHTLFKVGYGYGKADRTYRIFDTTSEDTFRVSFDTTGNRYFTARVKYERTSRDGSGFNPELLEHVGEQPGMRHFDIANRDRERFTAIATVMPSATVSAFLSAGVGNDDYDNSEFGLQDNKHRVYSIGIDASPHDNVSFGGSYTYEDYETLQFSRVASSGAQFIDPTRNFSTEGGDTVHTVNAYVDLLELASKVDLRFGYDFSTSDALYVYGVGSGLDDPAQLPPVENELQRVTVDARYALSTQLSIGFIYWYDDYRVQDFALDGSTGNTPPSGLLLGNFYEPYTVHTGWLTAYYSW